jgi:hypothetical protein
MARTSVGVVGLLALVGCGKTSGVPTLPEKVVGHCTYVNQFSQSPECRDYVGEWSDAQATSDCKAQRSTVELGTKCDVAERLGYCILTGSNGQFTRISLPGSDASKCGSSKRGCELFGGGVFDPATVCGGVSADPSAGSGLPTFQQPSLSCVPPREGEAPGASDGGLVCTWEMISGATEEGRRFEDYASCDRVRTQRPYYAAPTEENATRDDPRLRDAAYSSELQWVRSQIEATACVCCHSTRAPKGTSNWYVDQPGNFLNGFYDRGVAMGAGWISTVGFGAYPKQHNNGFGRATPDRPNDTIFVTTDAERMKAFFVAEAQARGLKVEDFANERYGAGPLDAQRAYVPGACEDGEGVAADGTFTWVGGAARYLYVLGSTSTSPGVPPNLDTPEGTRWRIDVPWDGQPVTTGQVRYGVAPAGFAQKFPATGAPEALVKGQQYYLYVLQDIGVPVTRCLFTAP